MTESLLDIAQHAKAAIFDCDGTLADTLPAHLEAWNQALGPLGVQITEAEHQKHTGKPSAEFIRDVGAEHGWTFDWQSLAEAKEELFKPLISRVRAIDPVCDAARTLAARMPVAVVSGGTGENVELTLEVIGLRALFPVVITADDDVRPKPAPDIFLEAARRLGVAPKDCVVYEDAASGIAGARAAGMNVIDIRPALAGLSHD